MILINVFGEENSKIKKDTFPASQGNNVPLYPGKVVVNKYN